MNILELRGVDQSNLSAPHRRLELCSDLRSAIMERRSTAADTQALLSNELNRARLANALGQTEKLRDAVSIGATMAAAMAMRESFSGGRVIVNFADNVQMSFPDGSTGATPPLWLDGLALAVLACDRDSCRCLADRRVLDAVVAAAKASAAPVGTEPFWVDYGKAVLHFLAGDPAAEAFAKAALKSIATDPTGSVDPQCLAATVRPVLELVRMLASGSSAHVAEAMQRAVTAFHAYYNGEETAHLLAGYLPLPLLVVCRLAIERGLGQPPESPYLPECLLRGRGEPCGGTVVFEFDRRSVIGADDAHWFLDLRGFPRGRRTHRLIDSEGQLVARYEAHDAPAMPFATAEFLLVDPSELGAAVGSAVPPALDAGELLFLAQAFASQHVESRELDLLRKQRLLLADAVACVDDAIRRIPHGVDAVPLDSIVSDEGQQILEREPSRFRRDRLAAYRRGLAAQLAELDATISCAARSTGRSEGATESAVPSTTNEAAARLAASAAIDMIRDQAMPVLRAIGLDIGGEFIASLQPREEDYAKVFASDAVEQARNGYRDLWAGRMSVPRPSASQTEIRCVVAPAGMLYHANELSGQFPGGYRAIAPALNPHLVWIAWKYLEPGAQSGLSFDGLVWVEDHWAWFPKPFRVIRGVSG